MAGEDEDAVQMAIETLYDMCGNAGQTAIIDEISDYFEEFAMYALEDEGGDTEPDEEDLHGEFLNWTGGREDKWSAVDQIMSEGWSYVQDMYGFHDQFDESGEGTGS